MDKSYRTKLLGFYENELVNNILYFWDSKSIDTVNGGYFNCFDNTGENLVSRDKYTWSQGRFIWLWSKLASMDCGTFSMDKRKAFLGYAKSGIDFMANNCLIAADDMRCAYLLSETGAKKAIEKWGARYDLSIYADKFVTCGFAMYSLSAKDEGAYRFAKNLYLSIKERLDSGDYMTLPYPLPDEYRTHPMGMINLTIELYNAALAFDPTWALQLKEWLKAYMLDMLDNFVKGDNTLLETILAADNGQIPNILGQHMNPGHVLEALWFMVYAIDILQEPVYMDKITKIAIKTLENGWDNEYGGILHFCGVNGGQPTGSLEPYENEPMTQLVLNSWGDKLWWVHSESLFTTLLLYTRTNNDCFLKWHDKIFDYTFEKHRNPNREVREWIQILTREGKPQDKIVALPVKDPYHIIRNLILIIELLYKSQ